MSFVVIFAAPGSTLPNMNWFFWALLSADICGSDGAPRQN